MGPMITEPNCHDEDTRCGNWAVDPGCLSDVIWFRAHCPVSCHVCQNSQLAQAFEGTSVAEKYRSFSDSPFYA